MTWTNGRVHFEEASTYHAPDPLDPSLHEEGELPPDPHFVHD
jgi:hypothetical protein